jgi:uncharacterized membrane protein
MNASQKQAVEILSNNSTQVMGKNSVSATLTKIPGAGYYDWDHIAVDGDTFYLAQTAADEHTNGVFYGGSALLNSKSGTITPETRAAINAVMNPVIVPVVAPVVTMKKCSCGHTIPAHLAMSASMGSSCPDCYDRMSD